MKDRDASAGTCTTRTLMKEGNPGGTAMSLPGMGDAVLDVVDQERVLHEGVFHGHREGVFHVQEGAVLDARKPHGVGQEE